MRILEFTDFWSDNKEYAILSHIMHWQDADEPFYEEYEVTVPKSLWTKEHKVIKTREAGKRKGSMISLAGNFQTYVKESPEEVRKIVQDAINEERNGASNG